MDDNTKNIIQNHIENNDVCLFMKGTLINKQTSLFSI